MATPHRIIRDLLPPLITRPLARRFLQVRYTGDYASWTAASAAAGGYDAPNILAQVTDAARAVRDGRAAFERDGIAFQEEAYNWPLLGCFFREALKQNGRLSVVDFGGALGSIYSQHRKLLRSLRELRWAVVEQPMFVTAGLREFATPELSFHAAIEDAMLAIKPNVVLFSGVLAWVENPHAILDGIVSHGVPAVIVDRTPLTALGRDVLKVQHVPAKIYRASYPCWFLSREKFLAHFNAGYQLVTELPQHDPQVTGTDFSGLYFERTSEVTHG